MRLGGTVIDKFSDPEQYIKITKDSKFRAVTFPLDYKAKEEDIDLFKKELDKADLLIAEVGAWANNPLHPSERETSIENITKQLALAERIGAVCCVNVAGSLSDCWYGPHMDSLKEDTFTQIVDAAREVIDAVKPKRTFFCYEAMPWLYPYDTDSYLRLIRAIDRKSFAVHLDIANMINSPILLYNNAALTADCFEKLGPYIKSLHVKDVDIEPNQLTVRLFECLVGTGKYDFREFFKHAVKLDRNTPFLVEHLHSQEEYKASIEYLTDCAHQYGAELV